MLSSVFRSKLQPTSSSNLICIPHYLSFCHTISKMSSNEHEQLSSLSRLVDELKPRSPSPAMRWRTRNCNLAMRKPQDGRSVPSTVEEVFQRNVEHMINEQLKQFVSALICLSSLKLVDVKKTKTSLKRIIQENVQLIEEEDPKCAIRARNKSISWKNLASSPV
jgi:hypothetical protein